MFQDKTLVCKDCGNDFSFTISEQEFFAAKGFTNDPGRCPTCREAKKERNSGRRDFGRSSQGRPERVTYPAVCHTCGVSTTVPFRPSSDKPVYCRDCYKPRQQNY